MCLVREVNLLAVIVSIKKNHSNTNIAKKIDNG
jgi:hypothetical protein